MELLEVFSFENDISAENQNYEIQHPRPQKSRASLVFQGNV